MCIIAAQPGPMSMTRTLTLESMGRLVEGLCLIRDYNSFSIKVIQIQQGSKLSLTMSGNSFKRDIL